MTIVTNTSQSVYLNLIGTAKTEDHDEDGTIERTPVQTCAPRGAVSSLFPRPCWLEFLRCLGSRSVPSSHSKKTRTGQVTPMVVTVAHSPASISSAMASILVTLFQLRAVPVVFSNRSTDDQGSLDLPTPSGK